MKYSFEVRSIYVLGKRANQEDCIYPQDGEYSDGLFIVCDGMGGHEKGEVASTTVCEVMSSYIDNHFKDKDEFTQEDFLEALSAAYDALDEKDDDSEKKMGTTLTFLKFHDKGCLAAHIGDSRIYHIRPSAKRILYVSHDHSLVNELIALGEMTPEEAKTSRHKNIITRAMQPGQERRSKADIRIIDDVRNGDYFYMCTDGMLEHTEDQEILNILSMKDRTDEEKMEIFRKLTEDNRDNHSAFLLRVTEGGNKRRTLKDILLDLWN